MGTEERVHTYVPTAPSDRLSVKLAGDTTERAMNAGGAYFSQVGQDLNKVPAAVPYEVNRVDYWHQPGDENDPAHGAVEVPRLPAISSIDNVTSRDTAEVRSRPATSTPSTSRSPTPTTACSTRSRWSTTCGSRRRARTAAAGMSPATGVAATRAVIVGHRGVGNVLTVDPVRSTVDVEKYDNTVHDTHVDGNGWFPGQVELRFRWYRSDTTTSCYSTLLDDWTAIPDADRQSYVPTNIDKGHCLMALVTGVKDGYRRETFPTTGSTDWWYVTLPIQDGTFDGQQPTIACDIPPAVGSELTASVVDFVPRPDSYTYQWYANGSAISGQTGTKVLLSAAEAGKAITVRVTGKRSGFDDRTETSAPCGPVALMEMTTTTAPAITGTPSYGQTLGVDTGLWEPTPSSFTYQWRLDNAPIVGATSPHTRRSRPTSGTRSPSRSPAPRAAMSRRPA